MLYNSFEVINMNRGLKNRTPISNAVDTKLYEQLKQLSKDTMIPMSKLLDRGIELIIKEYKKPSSK
jgi:hypothetical protein